MNGSRQVDLSLHRLGLYMSGLDKTLNLWGPKIGLEEFHVMLRTADAPQLPAATKGSSEPLQASPGRGGTVSPKPPCVSPKAPAC